MRVHTCSWFDTERITEHIVKGRRIVSICRSEPRNFPFSHKIWEFCPSAQLLRAFKQGKVDETEYQREYSTAVGKRLRKGIEQLEDGDVLCCWETEGNFCHRYILADLLTVQGVEVEVH